MIKNENTSTRITFIVVFALIILVAFKIVSSFIVSIAVGSIIAQSLKPLHKKIISKKINSTLAAYLVFAMLLVVVVVPIAFFIRSLIEQALSFSNYISSSEISFRSFFESLKKLPMIGPFIFDSIAFETQLKTILIDAGTWISKIALREASRIPLLIVETFFALLSCLFLLIEDDKFFKYLHDKILLSDDIWKVLLNSFKESTGITIWATLLGSVSQSFVIFMGFIFLGVPSAFLAAGVTFILSFIPIIGAMPVWFSAVVYLYIKGSTLKIFIMIFFGIITSLVDNIVRPVVLKRGKKGLHPFIGLLSVLGGIEVFGLFGVLIGPIIVALLISMLERLGDLFENNTS